MKTLDPKEIVREEIHTEGRRGFRSGDTVPRKQFWPTPADAAKAMEGSAVAFRVYCYADGTAGLSILSDYVLIERARKGKPWKDTGRRILASCQWDADEQAACTENQRALDPDAWREIQVKQHLRAVGISTRK